MCARSAGLDVSECIIFLFERGKNRFKNPKRKQENHEKPAEIKRAFILRSKASPFYSVLILFYIFIYFFIISIRTFWSFPPWKITIANSRGVAIFAVFHYCVIHMLWNTYESFDMMIPSWWFAYFFYSKNACIFKKFIDLSHLSARFFRYLGP